MDLIVLGNGFDIAHGILYKYSDFRDYLKENNKKLLETCEKYVLII